MNADPLLQGLQAFVSYMADALTSPLGLQSCVLDKSTAEHPRYPSAPRTALPKLVLAAPIEQYKGKPGMGWDYKIYCNWWFYRLQVQGADNHTAIIDAGRQISTAILARPSFPGLSQAKFQICFPDVLTVHSEIEHDSKDIKMRVDAVDVRFWLDSNQ